MSLRPLKVIACAALGSLVALIATCFTVNAISTANRLRAKITETHMVDMDCLLMADQPNSLDAAAIRRILHEHQRDDYFFDGWGRPFVVEMWKDRNGILNHYRVISLGRSGKRSECCKLRIGHEWDLNSVIEDCEWKQLWD